MRERERNVSGHDLCYLNRWFAAYADAGSFRYSHYFVCYISECTAILSGLGSHNMPSGQLTWSQFRVVHPLDIEWPRSMPIVVTSWNLPMHHFLKNCESPNSHRHALIVLAVFRCVQASHSSYWQIWSHPHNLHSQCFASCKIYYNTHTHERTHK